MSKEEDENVVNIKDAKKKKRKKKPKKPQSITGILEDDDIIFTDVDNVEDADFVTLPRELYIDMNDMRKELERLKKSQNNMNKLIGLCNEQLIEIHKLLKGIFRK